MASDEDNFLEEIMAIMFSVLKTNLKVKIEKLVLNRNSFGQTAENLNALGYLVNEGRVEMTADENNNLLVSLKDPPTENEIASGEVSNSHFILTFDFKQWKSMKEVVKVGEELMPNRVAKTSSNFKAKSDVSPTQDQDAMTTTPTVKTLSKNRGLAIQEHTDVLDLIKNDDHDNEQRKRKLE